MENNNTPRVTVFDTILYGINTVNENIVTLSKDIEAALDELAEIKRAFYTAPNAAGADNEEGSDDDLPY